MFRKLAVVALAVSLAACGLTPTQEAGVEIVVKVAAREVIKRGASPSAQIRKAQNIKSVVDAAVVIASGDVVTVELLRAAVDKEIAKLALTPADQATAADFVSAVVQIVADRVGDGTLQSDRLIEVVKFLEWISEATDYILVPAGGVE